ncbi:putative protein TIC 214 N-terminal part [Rutidosis leptorrhynchoides]|uniref:putative protein TIC 214 N-terminal part n=1 Tax=Rutidosis leptorrhynchoides TaxID=125765 RepID=UPI003A9A26F5
MTELSSGRHSLNRVSSELAVQEHLRPRANVTEPQPARNSVAGFFEDCDDWWPESPEPTTSRASGSERESQDREVEDDIDSENFEVFIVKDMGQDIIVDINKVHYMDSSSEKPVASSGESPTLRDLIGESVNEEDEVQSSIQLENVSATTSFITGQLMMFISIYYAPLHLALGRPHTITVLALLYLLFHFFWNNHKHFFDYGSTTRNSMRNLSIQCVFLNNLIFQSFNHFILPSSMLVRLVNIYMFRCNNKMLFVTSSFVGWLIGHILFMKWLGLVLVWIQQKKSIRSNVLIRSNKYLVSELRNSMARIFSILLLITYVYYLGRMPSPIFTKKLKENVQCLEDDQIKK